jgi:anti-anti-sigma factor
MNRTELGWAHGATVVESAVATATGSAVLWLHGEFDAATASLVTDALTRLLVSGRGDVSVNLSEVQLMSVGVARVLARARESFACQDRALAWRVPSFSARRVLGLCGLERGGAPFDAPTRVRRRYPALLLVAD